MRKILFTVFAGALIIVGCSKSSDGPASIVGTWQVNKVISQIYAGGVLVSADTATEGSVTFNSNGTVISTDSTGSDTSRYAYNSSSKILSDIEGIDTLNAHVTNLTSSNLHYHLDTTVLTERIYIDADLKR